MITDMIIDQNKAAPASLGIGYFYKFITFYIVLTEHLLDKKVEIMDGRTELDNSLDNSEN